MCDACHDESSFLWRAERLKTALKQEHHFFDESGNDVFIVHNIANVYTVHKCICVKSGARWICNAGECGTQLEWLEKPANNAEIRNEKPGKPYKHSDKAEEGGASEARRQGFVEQKHERQ